jgi:hypothetical protein
MEPFRLGLMHGQAMSIAMTTKPATNKSNGNGHKPSLNPKPTALDACMSGADQSEYSIEQLDGDYHCQCRAIASYF